MSARRSFSLSISLFFSLSLYRNLPPFDAKTCRRRSLAGWKRFCQTLSFQIISIKLTTPGRRSLPQKPARMILLFQFHFPQLHSHTHTNTHMISSQWCKWWWQSTPCVENLFFTKDSILAPSCARFPLPPLSTARWHSRHSLETKLASRKMVAVYRTERNKKYKKKAKTEAKLKARQNRLRHSLLRVFAFLATSLLPPVQPPPLPLLPSSSLHPKAGRLPLPISAVRFRLCFRRPGVCFWGLAVGKSDTLLRGVWVWCY